MPKWTTVGYIGVDSGTVMVVDPCYIIAEDKWMDFHHEYAGRNGFETHSAEMECGGVAVTTAHGDGEYPVEARFDTYGRVLEIRIKFDYEDEN